MVVSFGSNFGRMRIGVLGGVLGYWGDGGMGRSFVERSLVIGHWSLVIGVWGDGEMGGGQWVRR
jgi:hypothetical protein